MLSMVFFYRMCCIVSEWLRLSPTQLHKKNPATEWHDFLYLFLYFHMYHLNELTYNASTLQLARKISSVPFKVVYFRIWMGKTWITVTRFSSDYATSCDDCPHKTLCPQCKNLSQSKCGRRNDRPKTGFGLM